MRDTSKMNGYQLTAYVLGQIRNRIGMYFTGILNRHGRITINQTREAFDIHRSGRYSLEEAVKIVVLKNDVRALNWDLDVRKADHERIPRLLKKMEKYPEYFDQDTLVLSLKSPWSPIIRKLRLTSDKNNIWR